ncbi:hypothetical protein JDS99_31165, partial [Bacillus cereus group sp. N6]|nr:hypothetical protein [Bacillus cereus group sp. N6]
VSMKYNIQTKVGIEQTQRIRLVKREAGFQWEGIVHEDLQRKEPSSRYAWMLNQSAFYTWIPHQQLAHCYEQLGDHKKAKRHQQKAKQFQQK